MLAWWRLLSYVDQLTPLVYDELRVVSGSYLSRGLGAGSQVTELVGQLFVELLKLQRVTLNDRSHFYAIAARLMRNLRQRRPTAGLSFSMYR